MILTLLLAVVAGILNATMDVLQFKHDDSVFSGVSPTSFWGKESWRRKYSVYPKPKFIGSTTIFVWLTDGWHLCKSLFIVTFIVCGVTAHDLWKVPIIFAVFSATFELFYTYVLRKK